jgi:hypothetical protein
MGTKASQLLLRYWSGCEEGGGNKRSGLQDGEDTQRALTDLMGVYDKAHPTAKGQAISPAP